MQDESTGRAVAFERLGAHVGVGLPEALSRAAAAIDLGDAGSSETGRFGAATIEAFSKTLSLSYVEEFPSRRRDHVARMVDFAAGQAVGIRSIDEGSSFIGGPCCSRAEARSGSPTPT